MTIRVYRVGRNGDQEEIQPRHEVVPLETVENKSGYPPCSCPRPACRQRLGRLTPVK